MLLFMHLHMFDTVAYSAFLALLPTQNDEKLCPPSWKRSDFSRGGEQLPSHFDFKLENALFGVRVFGQRGVIRKGEVELPKLLYGHNGRLLAAQSDVDLALSRLKAVLKTIATPYGEGSGFFPGDRLGDPHAHYTRLDVVWQFDIDPAFVFLALKDAKHPEINKRTARYEGETILFPGTNLQISAYDKKAKMKSKQTQNAVRIEVRYEDEKLRQHFCPEGRKKYLDFEAAYNIYRTALLGFGFVATPNPAEKGGLQDYLAWVASHIPDHDAVGVYCAMKQLTPRKARELRKDVGKRVPSMIGFSWESLLPAHQIPPVVNVPVVKMETKFNEVLNRLRLD